MALKHFKNTYFALRHGESVPNTRGVILSDPAEGAKPEHTLTANGEAQARASAEAAKASGMLGDDAIIYSSPFSRCLRTAAIAREVFGVRGDIIVDDRLSERWFGEWEGTPNTNYEKVWAGDVGNPHFKVGHVESSAEVVRRVSELIADIEKAYSGKAIVLVSHGDALQILQTYFHDVTPDVHRSLPHLQTAEIRRLN